MGLDPGFRRRDEAREVAKLSPPARSFTREKEISALTAVHARCTL